MHDRWILATGLVAALFTTCPAAVAGSVSVDFTIYETLNAPTIAIKDMLITGDDGSAPANVLLLKFNGLGIVGGTSDTVVDGMEGVRFDFLTLAGNARYHVGLAGNGNGNGKVGESTVEAFVGTTSLGVLDVDDVGWKDVSAMFGGVAVTGFRVRAKVDTLRIDAADYTTYWDGIGPGLAGTHGVPVLAGSGWFVPGLDVGVTASGLLENASATLVLGNTPLLAPFKGGVMVPSLDLVLPGLATGPAGSLALSTTWPAGVPAGFTFALQLWVADPGGPHGFAATNGLRATAP